MYSLLQPTIDTLLNVAIFMWYGVVCPWNLFWENDTISFSHLIILGVLILALRRLPYIFAFRSLLPQTRTRKDAAFMGFFGPIGCSAMFYLYITMEFVNGLKTGDGDEFREDVKFLREDVRVVVWFLMICSVVVHGLCIPLGNVGLHLRRVASGNLQLGLDRYRTGTSLGNASLFSADSERQPILGRRL